MDPCCSRPVLAARHEVLWAEGLRQDLTHGHDPFRRGEEAFGAAVLPQELPTPATGHEGIPVLIDASDGNEPTTAGGVKFRHHAALGAQPHSVCRVLHIAPGDDPSIIDKTSDTDLEA